MSRTSIVTADSFDTVEPQSAGSLRDVLHVVFKRKGIILAFFVATVTTVAVVSLFFSRPMYQATSQLMVSPGREHVSDLSLQTGGAVMPRLAFNAEEQISRTTELLTSRYLTERVVKTIGPKVLYPDIEKSSWGILRPFGNRELDEQALVDRAVGRLIPNIVIESVGKSSLVNLSFKHENPDTAAKVVNLLGEYYLERHIGVQKNPKTEQFFQEQFQELTQKRNESERRFEDFKRRHNITTNLKDDQDLALRQVTAARAAVADARKAQAEVDSRLAELRRQIASTASNPGAISSVREKLTALELQENELLVRLTPEHPTVRSLREEIRGVREKLGKLEGAKPYGTASSRDGSLYSQLQGEILRNEAELRALRSREQAETARLNEAQARLDSLERLGIDFAHLQQLQQNDEQDYRLYQKKFEEFRLSGAMDSEKIASVRVIEPAEPPRSPLDSKTSMKILLGVFFGMVGGVALAFLLQITGGRLDTTADVERCLGLPVLATIPKLGEQ